MLTIKQLADYVGVTPRAVRHYHRIGLLPEPPRSHSGYRRYQAADIISLQRIKVLSEAGIPLARVRELLSAGPEALAAVAAEVDTQLKRRIAELQRTRRRLGVLLSREHPLLDAAGADRLAALLRDLADAGISEETIENLVQSWVLVQVLYPELLPTILSRIEQALADPTFRKLCPQIDGCRDWDPEDPRLDDLARQYVEAAAPHILADSEAEFLEDVDPIIRQLLLNYEPEFSPALITFMNKVEQLQKDK